MPPVRVIFLAALLGAAGPLRAAVLREATGLVQIRPAGGEAWRPAGKLPRTLDEGDGMRTGFNARAVVELRGGTILESAGNAHVSIELDAPGRTNVHALFGTVLIRARAQGGRAVSLRTPTCVVRARGHRSAFKATVGGGGGTIVEALDGAVGVEDNRGRSILLSAGQKVETDAAGLHEATAAPTPVQARKIDFAAMMRRELGYELTRDADFAAVSREARRGERELGRVLVDADGKRARVEEYVVRPSASRFNWVTLNARAEGMSYLSFDAQFDRALPLNLEAVLENLTGSAAATPWTLTGYVKTLSDGVHSLTERGLDGHQVDVNANADPLDDEGSGTAFRTIFDRWGLYADGTLKRGQSGVNLQQYSDATASTVNDPLSGAALGAALPVVVINASAPDASRARRVTLESYGDGTSLVREALSLEFGGGVGPRAGLGAWDRNAETRATVNGAVIKVLLSPAAVRSTELAP